MLFTTLVILHILAACVWTGGQLILNMRVLPDALKAGSVTGIRTFEEFFEPLRVTSLATQVLSGLWMAWIYLPSGNGLFTLQSPIAALLTTKLILLAIAFALALHAQLRLIPNLTDDNLVELAWHIRSITTVSIAFVVVGVGIRLGGF
jgi:putative copper export protein